MLLQEGQRTEFSSEKISTSFPHDVHGTSLAVRARPVSPGHRKLIS